jgi:GDP-L-fucose synthase
LTADTRIYIAGHRGLVGSALWRYFHANGFRNVVGRTSAELDLRDTRAVDRFFAETQPEVVIDAAARVGGIAANSSRQAEFCSDNLRIQVNLFDSAVSHGVERLLFLGSSCIYPKEAEQPIRESAIFTGPLERTNEGYAIAKLAGIGHLKSIRRQYNLPYIAAMPTNLYGPGDNFNLHQSHVLPAMLRRFHEAARDGVEQVVCWGTGNPMREFLYVDDLAEACHVLLDEYDEEDPINVGTGVDLTIAELARTVAELVGYDGEIHWDATKPDGTYRKVLDVSRLADLGWRARTDLREGLARTYRWYLENEALSRR